MNVRLKPAPKAKFFFGVMSDTKSYRPELEAAIERIYGSLGRRSSLYCFSDFSRYYDAEFGGTVWKYFVGLEQVFEVDRLVEIKLFAEAVESEFRREREGSMLRSVNVDPGYVNEWQLVLSTVKNHAHRIYLGRGVFSEVTLIHRDGQFNALPWTYKDYLTPVALNYFNQLRADLIEEMRVNSKTR